MLGPFLTYPCPSYPKPPLVNFDSFRICLSLITCVGNPLLAVSQHTPPPSALLSTWMHSLVPGVPSTHSCCSSCAYPQTRNVQRHRGLSQWPGTMVHISKGDVFAINTSNCFGLASASGVWGHLADALCDIFCASGIGPVSKWVDDFVFFCILVSHLADYSTCRAQWAAQIHRWGGQRHKWVHTWYQGDPSTMGATSEFNKECTAVLQDLSHCPLCLVEDLPYLCYIPFP